MIEFTTDNVKELFSYPDTQQVFMGQLLQPVVALKVRDNSPHPYPTLLLERGDYVLVSVDHDGTEYFNFMSEYNTYHYRALMSGNTEPIINIIEELHHV